MAFKSAAFCNVLASVLQVAVILWATVFVFIRMYQLNTFRGTGLSPVWNATLDLNSRWVGGPVAEWCLASFSDLETDSGGIVRAVGSF